MTLPPLIVTDSTCDLPPDQFEHYNIQIAPLQILFGDESYRSNIDMDLMQFVERLEQGDHHPTSSQPTPGDFLDLYRSLAEHNRPILSIHLSEGLSGTVNAARQAAAQLPDQNITVYDSRTISAALGLQVLTAARAAAAGYSVEQILPLLEDAYTNSNFLFTLDDLSYLVRGGRIGRVRYHVGEMLRIKPLITVSKSGETLGTYVSAGRVRSLEKGVDAFVKQVLRDVTPGSTLRAMVFHGVGNTPELAESVVAELKQHYDCIFATTAYSTPILGVHVGPLALDMGYMAGDWPV